MKKISTIMSALILIAVLIACNGQSVSPESTAAAANSSQDLETETSAARSSGTVKPVIQYPPLIQKPDGKLKIAYLLDGLFNDSSQRHWQQVQNECAARGWELISDTNVSGNYEADPTRTAFQRMMTQSVDAIVFSYLDVPPFADLVIEARQRGIGVYCIGTDNAEGILLNVNSDNSILGAKIMAYAVHRMNGTGDVIGFMNLWMPRGIQRDVVAATLIERSGYDFGETVHHNITPEGFTDEMFNVATNWLNKYGNRIDMIWACWDLGSITIAQAMQAKGFTRDDMFTIGIDGGSQAWAYIRNADTPFVASLAEPFEYQVHMAFEGISQLQTKGMNPGDLGCIVPRNNYLSTDNMLVVIDESNVPKVGDNIHSLFNYYGGKPDDPDAWYNRGKIYTVQDFKGE
jgi:ABC-type sugar transport system substrate-binding protein